MDRDTELALVDRLRAGDAGAFDLVHEAFHARLVTFLARLSRRRDVAEDLVEETWLRLVSQAVRLRPDTRLGPWLFTVARNLYVSYCRSRLLEESHAADLFGLWPDGAAGSSPFEATAATEFERRLEAALASLPASSREVLLLVAVEGLRPAEAAVVCGIAPEALRQRLSRARAQLARRLETAGAVPSGMLREVTP
ncbi:MAG TPA: RNA polymerase sigma factor [Vicinamibacterales bacterium]|nr:RNA polymerase sigma factor [Vicinamibacterales bacterium]